MADNASADIHDYLKLLDRVPETFRRSWDAIAIYDIEGRVIVGNAVARAMIGTDRALALRGRHFTAHLTLEAATKAARDFAHCVTLGQTVDSDSEFIDARGEPIPVRMRLVPARLEGRIVGVIGFARDSRARLDVEAQFMRSEQQFRSLFENHPDALALHDLEGRFLRVNAASERLTGYTIEELIGQSPAILAPTGGYDAEGTREIMQRGETQEFEHPIRTKSGAIREINGRRVPLYVDGKVRGFCGMIRDVTEERRAARNSARQATRIAELYRIAAAAGIAQDERVLTALEAGLAELGAEWAYVARTDASGFEVTYAAGTRPERVPVDADRQRLRDELESEDVFVFENPAAYPRSLAGAAITVEGKRYGAIAFVHTVEPMEITAMDRDYIRALAVLIGSAIQQGERSKRLDSLAFGDALTGLPNRALLQDRLEQTLLSARRHRRSFAAHYVDIDHFKTINDTYGHHVGDAVLIAVATWMRSVLRDSDTIGRIGGDEFVVLQPEIDSQRQAEELAAKLCSIRDQPLRIGARDISVTISVGCAVFPVDAENPVDMLKAADGALYDVKHRGRDGFAIGVAT
ncbi:MAG TPA: diguanylate cyclase [Candidatus Lustribacter sp.]|nr:diguanylate cyclase [Candidatus Lustribacter sp.]